jgi:hypothetical protein
MLDLNKQMEAEVSALTLDSENLRAALDNYQLNLKKAMDQTMF